MLGALQPDDHVVEVRQQFVRGEVYVREGTDGRPQSAHGRRGLEAAADHVVARGAIPGALNLPVDELRARQGEIPAGRALIVHCQVGLRGHTAARLLTQLTGRPTANLDGGYATWAAAHTTESAAPAPLAA